MKDRCDSGTLRLGGLVLLPALTILLAFAGSAVHGHPTVITIHDPDEPKGTVEVRVTDPEGGPVADARAFLEWRTPGPQDRPQYPAEPTDETGLSVRELPVGRWAVWVRAHGHLPATETIVGVTEDEVTRVGFTLVPVEVTDVTVRVTGPVPGRDTDKSVPIEGVEVGLRRNRVEPEYYSNRTTDAEGRVRFESVAEGSYGVVVEHRLYPTGRLRDQRITLATEELAVRLEAPPGGWAPLSGRVARDGVGVAGVEVMVSPQDRSYSSSWVTDTGADGALAFPHLPVGEYRVSWHARRAESEEGPRYPRRSLPSDLSVGPGGVDGLELPLPRGVHVHGPVENLGPPSDSGSYVVAYPVGDAGRMSGPVRGMLAEDGYHGLLLPPGTWKLIVNALGRETTRTVELPESTAVDGGELELAMPLPPIPPGHTVRGTVLRKGNPLEGVYVHLLPRGASSVPRRMSSSEGPTGPDGRFTVLRAPAGEYLLEVRGRFMFHEERITVEADLDLTLEARLASRTGRVIDAVTGEAIPGARVEAFHRPSDEEIREHELIVEDDGTFRVLIVRPGRWRFTVNASGYSPTRHWIDLEPNRDDGAGEAFDLEVNPTAGLPLHVTMENGEVPGHVSLFLRDPDEPEPDPYLDWLVPPGKSWSVHLGGDPVVVWKNAVAGRWRLEVRTDGGGLVTRDVEIAERVAPTPLEIELPTIGRLTATVPGHRLEGTSDPSEIRFFLVNVEGEILEIGCGECRRFETLHAEDLPPGRYVATLALPDGRAWSAEVEVEPGEQSEVELLPEGSS
jgi:hypothetical protein